LPCPDIHEVCGFNAPVVYVNVFNLMGLGVYM